MKKIKIEYWKYSYKAKGFLIEFGSIYVSILLITIIIQKLILNLEIPWLCFLTPITNIIVIIWGKKQTKIQKTRILKALFYMVIGLPYIELLISFINQGNLETSLITGALYATSYFLIGYFEKPYFGFIRRIVHFGVHFPEKTVKNIIGEDAFL